MTPSTRHVPLLRLPATTLLALHRVAAHDRSASQAALLVRQAGADTGEAFYDAFAAWLAERSETRSPQELPAERFWPLLGEFFAALGWGHLDFERTHPGVASLASSEWAEAEVEPDSMQPVCHFTTGLLADLLSRVAGRETAVMEVECRSRHDARCRFLLGSPHTLGAVYERVREGRSYVEALDQLA
jgi:predicted hydrocarbon binding protein